MSRTVCAVSEAKSRAPATGLVTVPTRPLPRPEKKPLTPPSVFTPSTVEVMMLVMPPMIPGESEVYLKGWIAEKKNRRTGSPDYPLLMNFLVKVVFLRLQGRAVKRETLDDLWQLWSTSLIHGNADASVLNILFLYPCLS